MPGPFSNPLSGVPHIESPFFDEIFREEDHSPEFLAIARTLRDKGYVVIDFPDADFGGRADRIIAKLAPQLTCEQDGTVGLHPATRVQDAWKVDKDVRALAINQTVLDLLTKLYGRRAWPFQTLNFPMGTQQHYHSDALHFSSMPERFMCGVWVALEDIGEGQGPLEYYPGSHSWPIYTNEHIGRSDVAGKLSTQDVFHELWEALVAKSGVKRETFCARKGQALIWTANLLHGGMEHIDRTKTRWSQVTHYYFEDCAYYTPMSSDPFRGLIRFREPVNALTGAKVTNAFNGKPIPPEFLMKAPHGFQPELTRETFDAAAYLRVNPDVAASKVDPWNHYQKHGRREGRPIG